MGFTCLFNFGINIVYVATCNFPAFKLNQVFVQGDQEMFIQGHIYNWFSDKDQPNILTPSESAVHGALCGIPGIWLGCHNDNQPYSNRYHQQILERTEIVQPKIYCFMLNTCSFDFEGLTYPLIAKQLILGLSLSKEMRKCLYKGTQEDEGKEYFTTMEWEFWNWKRNLIPLECHTRNNLWNEGKTLETKEQPLKRMLVIET